MEYAGREWFYSYRELFKVCDESKLRSVSGQILQQYSKSTKAWNEDVNSEWACRIYLSTKMILNATVLLNSLDFASNVGMRTANPYFEYYACLSLLRAVVYTLPDEEWRAGELMAISHTRAINVVFDWVAKFNRDIAGSLKDTARQLKAQREVISYKAPASGDSILGNNYNLVELLTILAELAQFNSELLEASVTKNSAPESFSVKNEHIKQIVETSIEGYSFHDREDMYRLGYIKRKQPRPYNLALFMTEGQTEDFIGAWDGDSESGETFTTGMPSSWQTIFEIP